MHLTTLVRRHLAAGILAATTMAGGTAVAQPVAPAPRATAADAELPPSDVKVDPKTGTLDVPLGGTARYTPPENKPITDIVNRSEDVLEVRVDPKSPARMLFVGRRPGFTRLTITYADATQRVFDVVVRPDFDLLRNVIKLAVPTANVEVIPGAGSAVILTGYVTKPEDADTILRIASDATGGAVGDLVNAIQVGGVQHVLIDLTIAQVDRTRLRERGFSFGVGGSTFAISSVLAGLADGTAATAAAGIAATPGELANIEFGIVPARVTAALRALRSDGLAKFLSEPKIVTQTGRPAFFRSGGQQATLGPASGINGPGVILQSVGTEVEVLPIVYGNGKIYVEVNPKITSVNNGRGITTAFGFTPGFNEQQTRVSVMMESGQTFAIGGLIETQVQATAQKVPYLGEIPILSWPFSFTSLQETETELLILLTPRLVDAMDCAQVPRRVPGQETRVPDDYELFLEQLIEAPRGQRQVWNGNCYNAAWKCDPNASKYPCVGNLCTGPNGGGTGGTCAGGNCGVAPAAADVLIGSPAPAATVAPAAMTPTVVTPTVVTPTVMPIPAPVPAAMPMPAPAVSP